MPSLSHSETIRFQTVNMNDIEQSRQVQFLTNWLKECPENEYVFCANKTDGVWVQEGFLVKDLRQSIEHRNVSIVKPNSFLSVSTFTNDKTRNYASLASLMSFFVDLDYMKIEKYAQAAGEEIAPLVLQYIEREQMPLPGCIVSTGHGLHLWWFMAPQPASKVRVWKEIQNELCKSLKQFGADDGAKDASRMLRVPYTDNAKDTDAAAPTSIIWSRGNSKLTKFASMYRWMRKSIRRRWLCDIRNALPSGSAYMELPLYHIGHLVDEGRITVPASVGPLPESTPIDFTEEKDTKPVKPVRKRSLRGEDASANTLRHVAAACNVPLNRIEDLKTLIHLRDGSVVGYRDKILFLANCFMQHAHFAAAKRLDELNRFNEMFDTPLPKNEVDSIWRNGRLAYTPSNAYIIRTLDISEAEQTVMKTVFSLQEKVRRRCEQNKSGMSAQERREFFITEILQGLSEGESVPAMAARLKTTRQTIYNWMKRYSLKSNSAVCCAKNQKDRAGEKKAAAKSAKRAAAELLRKIHADAMPRGHVSEPKQKKRASGKLKKQAIEIFLRLLEKNHENELLEYLKKAFFEITGKDLPRSGRIVKIPSTYTFRKLVESVYWKSLAPQYGKSYGIHAASLLSA